MKCNFAPLPKHQTTKDYTDLFLGYMILFLENTPTLSLSQIIAYAKVQ